MAAIAGKGGSVKVGAGPSAVALVKTWNLDPTMNTADISALGVDYKSFIATVYEWTVAVECSFDMTDTNGQLALQTAFLAGTPVAWRGMVNASNYYGGNIIITSMPVAVVVDDAVTVSFNGQGTGALAYT